jgi:hypothetical protein
MKNALSVFAFSVLAAALPGSPALADQPQTDPKAIVTDKPDPTLTPRDMNEREQEYLSDLKKCEPLADAERRKCVAALKEKHGIM